MSPFNWKDVRGRGFQDRADLLDAQAVLRARLRPLESESMPLTAELADRILMDAVAADREIPPFPRAAMDGYAVRGDETFGAGLHNPLTFSVIGVSLPGRRPTGAVGPGQAMRIMTGAPLPDGADAVVPFEATEEVAAAEKALVRIVEPVPPGRHVGQRGEDITRGASVLPAGRRLRPQDLGVLASLGANPVRVVRRPRVAILITGDELLPCGQKPVDFRIVDSNSVMLAALVARDGGVAEIAPLLPDQPAALRAAVAAATADVILFSGGSSVGQEDHAPRVITEMGELLVHGLALRPAGPAGFGFLTGSPPRPIFLLPGNPVSCLCAYDLLAGIAVRMLGGRSADLPHRRVALPLARKLASPVGRVDYTRVVVRNGLVEPLATSGASLLSSTTRADGFVLVPRDSEGFAAGEQVEVHLYDP